MEVTASGVPKPRRQQLQALVERLRGSWSGALTVGRTAAVIVEGPILDWEAPKLAVAQRHGIPLVSTEWLLDSAAHGFLLATGAYELEPPPAARRSSAASTSLAATGPPSASATCAAAAPPRSPHHPVVAQQAAERRAASPEVERLRGEARLLQPSPLAPLLLERSAGPASPAWPTGSPAGTKAAPLAVAHDTLQDLPPSPASPGGPVSMGSARRVTSSAAFSGLLQQSNCASGGSAAVPSPRWLTGSGKGSPAALEATPVSCTSSDGSNGSAAGSPVEQDRRTDSDTKVARFLRLQPWVTLRRGSQHVRRFMRPDSISSKGTSIRSSPVGTDAGGSPGSCDGGTPQPFTQVEADGAAEQPDKQPAAALSLQQEQRRRGLQPTPPSILRRWYTLSVARMQPSMVEGRLPATTLIRLGPQQEQQPGASTLEGIAERHCGGALGAEAVRQLPQLSFHSSAEALLEGGEELRFTAGR